MTENKNFYCGTSNIELPVPNKSFFPEAFQNSSRLEYYASLFNSVEINSTFYKIPLRRTIEKWSGLVPENFRFTFKLWKGITHCKDLIFDENDVAKFFDSINGIGAKGGCILIQLPGSIKFSLFERFKLLLRDVNGQKLSTLKIAVEFRDRSWYHDRVYSLMEEYDATLVIHDIPRSSPPYHELNREHVYLRFHGPTGDYRSTYEENFLQDQSVAVKEWLRKGKTVFAYFNNTIGDAVQNAMHLLDRLRINEW